MLWQEQNEEEDFSEEETHLGEEEDSLKSDEDEASPNFSAAVTPQVPEEKFSMCRLPCHI